MLAEEVTEMNEYGYFVDIDNGSIMPLSIIEREREMDRYIICQSPYETDRFIKENKVNDNPFLRKNSGLFCINTFCFMAVSFIFIKLWVYPNKT